MFCHQRRNLMYKAAHLFRKQEKYLGVYRNKYYVHSRIYKKHKNKMSCLLSRYINYVNIGLFSLLYTKLLWTIVRHRLDPVTCL